MMLALRLRRCGHLIPNADYKLMVAVSPQDLQFQDRSLQQVSRTFALTIPELPPRLRTAVGNAYLLCRIADTIEDEPQLNHEQQQHFAALFTEVVSGNADASRFSRELGPLLSDAVTPAERDLVAHADIVLRITQGFNDRQRHAMARCIRIMASGMADFQQRESLAGLSSLADMDQYCYYVAGVVGEMLTELFCDYSPEIQRDKPRLMRLGISFGQGLQMTNILKDFWEDRSRGACWLPRDLFLQHGVSLEQIRGGSAPQNGFHAGLEELLSVAKAHLNNALTYTLLIPPHEDGIRRFCLWALGMAVLTLRKIYTHKCYRAGTEVKISRRTVKVATAVTSSMVRKDNILKLLFYLLTFSLPSHPHREQLVYLNYSSGTHTR